jgi:hypothetical protein
MKKTHTKANGYFKDLCAYSKTSWAWWHKNPNPNSPYKGNCCTCIPCKPPKVTK